MPTEIVIVSRVFKTAWFAKASRKTGISDNQLCIAIAQVMQGQADDLGGGVFKKRLNDNRHRSIILAKGSRYWIYEYLFAKKTGKISMPTNSRPFVRWLKTMPSYPRRT